MSKQYLDRFRSLLVGQKKVARLAGARPRPALPGVTTRSRENTGMSIEPPLTEIKRETAEYKIYSSDGYVLLKDIRPTQVTLRDARGQEFLIILNN